jgi:hypothetical protein
MTKTINLKFAKNSHYDYLGMHVSDEMKISELLNIIGANEIAECNHINGHIKLNEKYKNSGELNDKSTYEVHTLNTDRTLKLIKDYKDHN